jgi:hypothetical protein
VQARIETEATHVAH